MAWTYLSATAAALRNCLSMDFQTARAYGRVLFGSVPAFRNGMLRSLDCERNGDMGKLEASTQGHQRIENSRDFEF